MASAAAAPPPPLFATISGSDRALATIAVMLATLMQVLDTTIANVALPHMQTSLQATPESINWVLTSYIVASAMAIPITGWLADRVGRKSLFIWTVVGFTASSVLCALAQNMPEMVLFRAIQGVCGAFILPLSQSVLFDVNPPENHAKAMAMFGGGVVIGPILGPVLGGWLTDSFDWRWVFLINLPIGAITLLMLMRFLPGSFVVRRRFDLFGFTLLAVAVGNLQLMLDRGEQVDWFQAWEIWLELGIALSAGWMFVVHMLTAREPIFDPAMFKDRNFALGILFMAVLGLLLMAGLALLPPLLQRLMGYSVLGSGFLTAPRGVGTLVSMMVVGRLAGKVDARILIMTGLSVMAVSLWQMSHFSLQMDSRPVIISGLVQGVALGFLFVPLNTLAFGTLEARFRTSAASILTLSRSLGGSVGISIVTALLSRNLQVSHSDLAANVEMTRLPANLPAIGDPTGMSAQTVLAFIDAEINRQAAMIAYIDDFHLMMIVTLCAMPLLLLLRKPRGGGGPAVIAD